MDVSILLLTYNEEANLPRCFDSIAWCDDILVIDSGSSDQTVEIARQRGARVISRPFDNFANQRNFGLEQGHLRHEWVLHLDADEVIPEAFQVELKTLCPLDSIDGYRVPSKTMLNEAWLRYSGMYPTYQVRIGHRDRLRFRQIGHGQREDAAPERIATFEESYLHYNFSHGIEHWFRKHARYAKDEADQILLDRQARRRTSAASRSNSTTRRRYLKMASSRLPVVIRPLLRFFYVFVLNRGFLDGRAGLQYSLMLTAYEAMIASFVLLRTGKPNT